MKIYKISAVASMGWILSSGEIVAAMSGHSDAVLKDPSKFGVRLPIYDEYCQAYQNGAVRYSKTYSTREISFEGTRSAIFKNLDVIMEISGDRRVFVDIYDTGRRRSGATKTFINASEMCDNL